MKLENNLGTDAIRPLVLRIAIPSMLAQFVSVLYSIVDRIYISNIPLVGETALAGVGVCGPVVTLIGAFASLIGVGGAPLMSIRMGAGKTEEARRILSNSFLMLCVCSVALMAGVFPLRQPMLMAFGASDATYGYANTYFTVYLCGTVFNLLALGLNQFIICQGYARKGMISVMLGAALNIVLDPVFIFVFGMGVSGAALATILSQAVSAAWVLRFLFSAKSGIRIRRGNMKFEKRVVGKVIGLGIAPFIMQSTESLVNITLNAGLQRYGGDLYVGSMTIMQSVMQMLVMPIQGITQGAQPIMSYNYGAKNYSRVRKTFSLLLKVMLLVTVSGFALAALLPGVLARMFTQDAELIEIVKKMMPIFFGGIWAFGAQMACQTTFMALGQAKISLFLALLRKVVLLVPLALLLPVVMGGNVLGIYIAEPVADVIASFTTLSLFLIKRKTLLPDGGAPAKSK